MRPQVALSGIKQTTLGEYALRFVFGGLICAVTGFIGQKLGPAVGGLFLSFPAILPASLTLVRHHDGLQKAVEDARGARLGSVALASFGAIVGWGWRCWPALGDMPFAVILTIAMAAWLVVGTALWLLVYGR
jgi:hypothetical protein